MKKEAFLFLVAGIVFGAVAGFILTREYYERKALPKAAGVPGAQAPATQQQGTPQNFDPDQHNQMISQFMEKAKDPDNVDAKVMLGNIYYDRQNFEEAAGWYEQALKVKGDDTNVIVDLGSCYLYQEKFPEAMAQFDKALQMQKDKKEALFNKAIAYLQMKEPGKAEEIYKKLADIHPNEQVTAELRKRLDAQKK